MLFFTLPRAPSSTLFPYTTLFRSRAGSLVRVSVGRAGECFSTAQRLRSIRQLDRKSTRLNSSHTVISYAVFCLTKKRAGFRHSEAVSNGKAPYIFEVSSGAVLAPM